MKHLLFFFFLFLSIVSFAQDRTIKGRVTDETGVPLQGVSVTPAGSKTGVQTDKDGNFSISIPGTGTITLNLSSSGYKPAFIDGDGRIILSVTMVKNVTSLDDVVVVGNVVLGGKAERVTRERHSGKAVVLCGREQPEGAR